MAQYVVLAYRFAHRTEWSEEGKHTLHTQGEVIELPDDDHHLRRLVEERIVEPKARHDQLEAVAATEGKLASEFEAPASAPSRASEVAAKAKG